MKTLSIKTWQPIFKYLRPYKKEVGIIGFFAFLEHLVYLISPALFGWIVDIVVSEKKFTWAIFGILLSWVILDLFGGFCMRIKNRGAGNIAYQAEKALAVTSIDHLMRLPISYHKNEKAGEIIQRIIRASDHLFETVEEGVFYIFPNTLTSLLAFGVILWINWILGLLYFIFIFLYVVTTVRKTNPIINYQNRLNHAFEKIYGNIFDRVPSIINVKSNSAEDIEHRMNVRGFSQGSRYNYHQVLLWTNLSLWQSWVAASSFVVLFAVGIYFVQLNLITIGQFVMLLTYINLVSLLLNTLADYYKRIQEGLVTIKRSEDIFKEIPEDYNNPEAIRLEKVDGNVEFKKVHFSYPEKGEVLSGISFRAKAGQMIAIVGKSGQGKSTVTNLISRYFAPDSGAIYLDGIDIAKIDLRDLRNRIAIVPQEVDLFNDTVGNNIRYSSAHATKKEIIKAAKQAHCHEFISKFPHGYDQLVGDNGSKLSTGQKQRIAIARAILRNPRILILDEATSALDSESEHFIHESLEKVMKGRTTFVIAHRLSTIRKADLILVLENGKIVERGDHEELLAHGGVYQKLSHLQHVNV
jgi:subfamily B ATP-binding cassette protein MsbA